MSTLTHSDHFPVTEHHLQYMEEDLNMVAQSSLTHEDTSTLKVYKDRLQQTKEWAKETDEWLLTGREKHTTSKVVK